MEEALWKSVDKWRVVWVEPWKNINTNGIKFAFLEAVIAI